MSRTRISQVWLGILGVAVGASVMLSGVLTAGPAEANDKGIAITVVGTASK